MPPKMWNQVGTPQQT